MTVADKSKLRVKMLKKDLGRSKGEVFYASPESAEYLVKEKLAEYVDQPKPKPVPKTTTTVTAASSATSSVKRTTKKK